MTALRQLGICFNQIWAEFDMNSNKRDVHPSKAKPAENSESRQEAELQQTRDLMGSSMLDRVRHVLAQFCQVGAKFGMMPTDIAKS